MFIIDEDKCQCWLYFNTLNETDLVFPIFICMTGSWWLCFYIQNRDILYRQVNFTHYVICVWGGIKIQLKGSPQIKSGIGKG